MICELSVPAQGLRAVGRESRGGRRVCGRCAQRRPQPRTRVSALEAQDVPGPWKLHRRRDALPPPQAPLLPGADAGCHEVGVWGLSCPLTLLLPPPCSSEALGAPTGIPQAGPSGSCVGAEARSTRDPWALQASAEGRPAPHTWACREPGGTGSSLRFCPATMCTHTSISFRLHYLICKMT